MARYQRCRAGEPCDEITARLIAADKSKREGFDDVAAALRDTAAMFAELHQHGMSDVST